MGSERSTWTAVGAGRAREGPEGELQARSAAALKAAFRYALTVFAAGFGFGSIRIFLVEPRIGPVPAALLEGPLMLIVSWRVCGWAMRRHSVARAAPDRLLMGGTAFALLMIAEFVLSLATGVPADRYLQTLAEPAKLIGLSAQLLFAAFPLLHPQRAPAPWPAAAT